MTNGTAPVQQRPSGAKMTIEAYTISRTGEASAPRATVSVPYGYEPELESLNTQLPPCACSLHRQADAR
ncbi:hypothetical protein [Streptomyces fulvoviolaceus]|uniref:hypothetical protein n=1 Tax=Streptomyces fulvoviolaceus TaxID=285535 RepID=UPI0021C07610|nr:hypothetical protein [Streptomyces fulvoviolaceus]MCT9076539.1 hypothetical protein [Streptomyces fulvoviolaceus]